MEKKEKIYDLVANIGHGLCGIRYNIEKVNHLQVMLGRMAEDANEKYHKGMQKYFLWDNHDTLQVISGYIYEVSKEMEEKYKEVEKLQSELFEIAKVGNIDKENTPNSQKNQG